MLFPFDILGEGTFGRVIQARAIGIVKDSPERNVVAIKTYRGDHFSPHSLSSKHDRMEQKCSACNCKAERQLGPKLLNPLSKVVLFFWKIYARPKK